MMQLLINAVKMADAMMQQLTTASQNVMQSKSIYEF
jgi:hypothetical protein